MSEASSYSSLMHDARDGSPSEASCPEEVLVALSISSSRFSTSFNDGQTSALRLITRTDAEYETVAGARTRVTGAAMPLVTGRAENGCDHADTMVAVETAPLIAIEGTESRHLAARLADRIASHLCGVVGDTPAHAQTASGTSPMQALPSGGGAEVLTYAVGHTGTGKTTLLLGTVLNEVAATPPLHRQERREGVSATPGLPGAGLVEQVLHRLLPASQEEAGDARFLSRAVALSVMELSEPTHLTTASQLDRSASQESGGLRTDHVTALDLLSGRRGRLLLSRDDEEDEEMAAREHVHVFMSDGADIPAAQYVRVGSVSEAMAVLRAGLQRAQSWKPTAPATRAAPLRPRCQSSGESFLDHVMVTLLVSSARVSSPSSSSVPSLTMDGVDNRVTGIWKLWDLAGPPAMPLTTRAPQQPVWDACWGWPHVVRQRLRALATLPSTVLHAHTRESEGTLCDRTWLDDTTTAAAPILWSARASASTVVMVGSLLHDACADDMNAYTLEQLRAWTPAQAHSPLKGEEQRRHEAACQRETATTPQGQSARAVRRAENLAAAERVLLHFAVPATVWLAQLAHEEMHAVHVDAHDARHHQLALSHTRDAAQAGHAERKTVTHGSQGTMTAPGETHASVFDAAPLASACALHYTKDITPDRYGIDTDDVVPHNANRDSPKSLHDPLVSAADCADTLTDIPAMTRDGTRVNRAAQAARAAVRYEDESRRRFLHATSEVKDDVPPPPSLGDVPRGDTTPLRVGALMQSHTPPSALPPPAAMQTERPDAHTRRAQQTRAASSLSSTPFAERASSREQKSPPAAIATRGAALFPSRLTINSDEEEEEEVSAEALMLWSMPESNGAEAGRTAAEWRQYIAQQLEPQLATVLEAAVEGSAGPAMTASTHTRVSNAVKQLEDAVWHVVAPLITACVQSGKLARASRAAWEDERARTRDLAERMARLENQLTQLTGWHAPSPAAPVAAAVTMPGDSTTHSGDFGRELPTPISPVQASHDRSLSASLSVSVSAAAPTHKQIAELLARSAVTGVGLARRKDRPAVRGRDEAHEGQVDDKDTRASPEPLFSVEWLPPEASVSRGVPVVEAARENHPSVSADHRAGDQPALAMAAHPKPSTAPTHSASSEATVWLDLEVTPEGQSLSYASPPTKTPLVAAACGERQAVVAVSCAPAAPRAVQQQIDEEDDDMGYPCAEVMALRQATAAVQNCALTVLSCEREERQCRGSDESALQHAHTVGLPESEPNMTIYTPSPRSTFLEGFVETPEKACVGVPAHTDCDDAADQTQSDTCARGQVGSSGPTATLPFSPYTLHMERKLYDAVSAMQCASKAVEACTRRAAEREQAYLQTILLEPRRPPTQ